ncbi:MAG TPA: DUF1844 domain-containing protein [Candidatus Omnitrophota bacterium]|nr:DUF1844 domain-containing protein [Candidatus Omnitrophota bacterium]
MDRDIRFSEKKVDESWKEQVENVKEKAPAPREAEKIPETSQSFLSLIQSLGYQALMHLGEIPNPMTNEREVQLESAKESIDLLIALRDKTKGNLSAEEADMLKALLTQLQFKFAQAAQNS